MLKTDRVTFAYTHAQGKFMRMAQDDNRRIQREINESNAESERRGYERGYKDALKEKNNHE